MEKQSLLIIGAGAAGLMAANELHDHFNITILEAQNRVGGRIKSMMLRDHTIESGAEFIHGKLPLTLKLLKEAGIEYKAVDGKMYRKHKGILKEDEEMLEGWKELKKKIKTLENDLTLHEFLETYFAGNKYTYFRQHIRAYAEGFDLADPYKVSIKSLYREWNATDEQNFRIPSGYSALMEYLKSKAEEKGCAILTGKIVKKISWQNNNVKVYTQDGQEFHADKLLVTVPAGILQETGRNGSIEFDPSVHDYVSSFRDIGFGSVIKVILFFREIFWEENAGFFLSDENYFLTWWTQLPEKAPILTGWCGGPKASLISHDTKDAVLQKALTSLAAVLGRPPEVIKKHLLHAEVFNWEQDEFASGGYSYETVHSVEAKEKLNMPLLNTLFFAGEALYRGSHPGTVEAALVSGKEVAKKIASLRSQ